METSVRSLVVNATSSKTAKQPPLQYLLLTPARNEEAFIEQTIESVIAQTIRPAHWLIISDGSRDRTDEIVRRYAQQHPWIELYRMPDRESRDFGGKARSFNTGYNLIKNLPHDAVVSLDADLTFDPEYFEFLLDRLAADPALGIVGTPFSEDGITYDFRFSSPEYVSGACQVFRRECFGAIGGYVESKGGGIDVIAVLTARHKGWRTRTFTEKACAHHRPMGSGNYQRKIVANFKLGQRQYSLGFHPLWQTFRSAYQMSRKPYISAGAALFVGYFWAMIRRIPRPVGPELIAFQRRDQMRRLRVFLKRLVGIQEHMPSLETSSRAAVVTGK